MHDGAVDDEARRAPWLAAWPGDETALDEPQDLELLVDARAIALGDGVRGPDAQIEVPERAVVGRDVRNPPSTLRGPPSPLRALFRPCRCGLTTPPVPTFVGPLANEKSARPR